MARNSITDFDLNEFFDSQQSLIPNVEAIIWNGSVINEEAAERITVIEIPREATVPIREICRPPVRNVVLDERPFTSRTCFVYHQEQATFKRLKNKGKDYSLRIVKTLPNQEVPGSDDV